MIETQSLAKTYGRGMYALRDLNLTIEKGEFVFLTGASGAGKSTLLRLLLLQERPSEGEIIVGGRNLSSLNRDEVQAYRRSVGFVFQYFELMPTKTIFENVSFVQRVLGRPVEEQRRNTYQVLGSGCSTGSTPCPRSCRGEQQRVAIARAGQRAASGLADEPTATSIRIFAEITNLFRDMNARGTTVPVATHDRELTGGVGRRVIQPRASARWSAAGPTS